VILKADNADIHDSCAVEAVALSRLSVVVLASRFSPSTFMTGGLDRKQPRT